MSSTPFYVWWAANRAYVRQIYFNRVVAVCVEHGVVASAPDYASLKPLIFKMKDKVDIGKLVVTLVT